MSSSTPTGIPYEPTMTALTVPLLIPSTGSSHVQKSLEMTGLQGQHFISIQDQRFVKKEVDEPINETTIKSVSSTSLPKCWNFLLGTVQKRMLHWNNKRTIGNENELFSCLINEVVELMSAFKAFVKACLQEADKDHTDSFQLTSEICLALGVPLESSWIVKGAQDIDPPHCYFFQSGGVDLSKREYNSDEDYDIDTHFDHIEEEEEDSTKFNSNKQENQFFSCYLCKTSFESANALLQHKKTEHSAKKSASLPKNSIEKLFKCDLCDFSASAQNGLSLHKRKLHHLDKNNEVVNTAADNPDFHARDPEDFQHQCSQCTRRYKKIHHLERHISKCDGIPPPTLKPLWQKNQDGRFSCAVPGCNSDKSWTSSFSVWHHFNAEHADMQDEAYCVFHCDMCSNKFPTKSMLTRHRNHKHEANFRFQCSVCPKRLSSNKSLKLHMTQHTGEKPFACDFCSYRAITQSIVNQHKLRMHEGSMPDKVIPNFVCEICGKSFKVKSNLKEHMASHSETRSFLCPICGKSLKNRQCLNRHLFTHGVKQTCSICNRNFANATSLGIHQREKHGLRN